MMHCVLLCLLEAVEYELCLLGDARGDTLCARGARGAGDVEVWRSGALGAGVGTWR
jgi:hypothetical protein